MWYLITSTGKHLYLKPNKQVTFGRKKCDILLQNDESISRVHAFIHIKPIEIIKCDEPISKCELKDVNSKYGTYIIVNEEEKLQVTSAGIILKNGDKIRFGLQQHVFTVVYVPLITVVSTFHNAEKQKLQGILDEIDGMISHNWTRACTHLTVSKAALTEKVTWAMASAVPIVHLNFWEAMKQAIETGDELPKPADFVPPIVESLVNKQSVSLCVNVKRKTLFGSFIFVSFSERQYKLYGKMISMAGGKSILYSKRPLTIKEICAPNVIVLQYPESDTTQSTQGALPEYETIYNSLRECKRKMIPETDIPLAILHCSTEKYCNPKYRFEELLRRSQSKPDSSKVLALDTQDLTNDLRILPNIISNVTIRKNFNIRNPTQNVKVIPESCDFMASDCIASQSDNRMISSSPKKSQDRKYTEVSIERGPAQKIKEVQTTVKYIPETKDSYDVQDLLSTSSLKVSQGAKSTPNSEISVERIPVKNVKEVQKAAKYIPETKDSYNTQDSLRSGTLKASQGAKSTPNSEISVERIPMQNVKEVQKAAKYIPETKDSYNTQDSLRSGTLKASQGAKSTPNSEISVERIPMQNVKEVQKAAKYIPETKDSYDTQDLLRSGTLKASQGAKSTPNSEISVERGLVQNAKEEQKAMKYIPETNDSTRTQDILRADTSKVSQNARGAVHSDISIERISTQREKEVSSRKTVKYVPDSSDLSADNDVSINKKSTQKAKEVNSQRTLKCTPQTNDSSDDNEKGAQCSLQRSQCVRNKNRSLQEISRMKESMIANKGTPAHEVIELINDEDDDEEEENKLEEILLRRGRSNRILSQEKLSKLVHNHSVRVKSPEVNRHCTPLSRADNNYSAETGSQIERESVKKSGKRKKSSDEFDSVEDFLTLTRKKSCSVNSVTEVPVTSSNTVKPSQTENRNNLSSSLRASVNFKKFKKVYNKIPQQRITLNDMYIWNMFNVENL
ncbi:nibrin isoform X2 [Halictus rubicundus]|uniref:nibrin isoform X2 n=1 Tax=Halictus rubicundus TaxID=77578 RepID=UPI0040373FBC